MKSLVLWEVSQKQNYIFSSNKLKENIGASIIIENIIEKFPQKINPEYQNNLIYNGGGSSLYSFRKNQEAKEFIKDISENTLKEFPGVEIFMIIIDYDDEKEKITEVIDKAYRQLAKKKSNRINSGGQVSFGIERICESSGLPAQYKIVDPHNKNKKYISKEIKVKIDNSNERSEKFSKLILNKNMTKSFREMAKGEKNYMAVVHIDGNKMGRKFESLKKEFSYKDGEYKETNRKYIRALKRFSDNIKNAYENAFIAMSKAIEANKDRLKDDTKIGEGIFPVIPIIVAGDDITYITNGKIGIETARIFLEHLYKNKIEIYDGKMVKLNACAGISLVRTSHPFKKAYELAENLCENAKKILIDDYPDRDYSLIDWHIEQGDISGNIKEIRDKNYMTLEDNKELFMRPLYLNNEDTNNWKTYDNFKEAYYNLNNRKIMQNKIARNKVKNMREVLKKGEWETKLFLESNNLSNYFSRFKNTSGEYCFNEEGCMYYDAIEISDLYIQIEDEVDQDE